MGKRQNLIEFLGEALNDSDLKENSETIKLGLIVSNAAPKRTSKPLTPNTTKNELSAILELSKKPKKKVVKKRTVTKSAKAKTTVKSAKSTKTKKRS